MSFINGLIRSVKNEAEHAVRREVGYATRDAVGGTLDMVANKIANHKNWRCACGAENSGKFCMECGREKGEGMSCVNCGWKATDKVPRFCPECGADFDGDENT